MGVGKSSCLSSSNTAQKISASKHDTNIGLPPVKTNNQMVDKFWRNVAAISPTDKSVDVLTKTNRGANHSKHSGKDAFVDEANSSPLRTSHKSRDHYQMFTSEGSCSLTGTVGQEVTQLHHKSKNKVSAALGDEANSSILTDANNAGLEKASKTQSERSVPRNVTSSFQTECPREADDVKRITGDENHAVNSSNKTSEYERDIKILQARVRQLTVEKDGLLNRLSEVQAINLTENNPNITDLSDASRPQKLAEQLAELYDNEWTDAYEYLTKRQEDTDLSAKHLLQILQDVYTICMSSTHKKKKALQKAITNYVGLTKEDQEEFELKDIQKRIREYRTKKLDMNLKKIGKDVEDKLKRSFTTDTLKDLSPYTGLCVSICWEMCTKEPPMFLDFCDSNKPADSGNTKSAKIPFDKDNFRSYKTPGDYIDYVVWPALYLTKGGQLMRKGVAQGIGEDKKYDYERDWPEK